MATVLRAAELAVGRRRVAERHVTDLRAGVPATVPMLIVPELYSRASGRRMVTRLADELSSEMLREWPGTSLGAR